MVHQDRGGKRMLKKNTPFRGPVFIKNRDPYEAEEAKSWFIEAHKLQKEGSLRKALGLYEKFSKRRSDASVNIDGSSVPVGPESLYRAAIIREKKETGIRRSST